MKKTDMKTLDDNDSPNYTLIGAFKTAKAAGLSVHALRRMLDDISRHGKNYETGWTANQVAMKQYGEKVIFTVYTNADLDISQALSAPRALLVGMGALKIRAYEDYQKLVVTATVPIGINAKSAILVMEKDDSILMNWFTQHVGKPKVKRGSSTQTMSWNYCGEKIYDHPPDNTHSLVLNDEDYALEDHKCWNVRVLTIFESYPSTTHL